MCISGRTRVFEISESGWTILLYEVSAEPAELCHGNVIGRSRLLSRSSFWLLSQVLIFGSRLL
jgi:hypothetical protein